MGNNRILKYIPTTFFVVGAISMLIMSNHYFQNEITGVMKGKPVESEWWYGLSLRGHIIFGLVAIFIGPFQFVEKLRIKHIDIHRRIGYIYVLSVLISGICGLIVAQFPMGGIISQIGFSTLAVFWLYSLFKSIKYIRNKNVDKHKKWMFINYGLTFAAIPQRTLLLIPLFIDVDFMDIYRLSAWLPWIMNTIIALLVYNKIVSNERQRTK